MARLALLSMVLLLCACGGTVAKCGPDTCAGCCDPDGFCRTVSGGSCSSPGSPCGFFCSPRAEPRPPAPVDAGGPAGDAGLHELRIFVSGAQFRGDLTRIAGIDDPLLAADSLCQRMAEAEALSGTWLAFLTADGGHPAERFSADGPWRSINGFRTQFANRAALYGPATTTLAVDERGRSVSTTAWTGLSDGGANCEGWTSSSADGGGAGTPSTSVTWSGGYDRGCATAMSIYCFEQRRELPDAGASPPNPTIASKRAFVTSLGFSGELDGVDGGHQRCMNAAAAAGLDGGWMAWLASDLAPAGSQFTFAGPWSVVGPARTTVVPSMETLRLGILRSTINRDEHGRSISSTRQPWTGSHAVVPAANNCANWTSTADAGRAGHSGFIQARWQDNVDVACDQLRPLYCFEQ